MSLLFESEMEEFGMEEVDMMREGRAKDFSLLKVFRMPCVGHAVCLLNPISQMGRLRPSSIY